MSFKVKETTAALRLSQEERDRLSKELNQTGNDLNKFIQKNNFLEQKTSTADAELKDLRNKCKKRKADICQMEEQLRLAKAKQDQTESQLRVAEQEVIRLQSEVEAQVRSGGECQNDFKRQLRQGQENFERQLDEAMRKYEALTLQKAEVETELRIAANNMHTLERQVQERDVLLEKHQLERGMYYLYYIVQVHRLILPCFVVLFIVNFISFITYHIRRYGYFRLSCPPYVAHGFPLSASLQQQIREQESDMTSLRHEASEKDNRIEALEFRISDLQATEEKITAEVEKMEAICQEVKELAQNRFNEYASIVVRIIVVRVLFGL